MPRNLCKPVPSRPLVISFVARIDDIPDSVGKQHYNFYHCADSLFFLKGVCNIIRYPFILEEEISRRLEEREREREREREIEYFVIEIIRWGTKFDVCSN